MDVASRWIPLLVKRLQAMSTAARLLAGSMVLVAIVSMAMLNSPEPPGPETVLLGGEALPPDQLPRIEAAFARAGLSDYRIAAGRVHIPSQRNAAYMAALAAADALPPNFSEILDKPLRQASPLMSRAQQEESIKIARQQALASIIQSMKGVQRAQVLYDREKKPGLAGGQNITASVTVTMQKGAELQPQQVEALRKLMAGAIAGLEPSNVAVIDLGSGRSFPPDGGDASGFGRSGEVAAMRSEDPPSQALGQSRTVEERRRVHSSAAPPDIAMQAWEWARRNMRALGMGGLALAGIVMVSAMARKGASPTQAQPMEVVIEQRAPESLEATPPQITPDRAAAVLPDRAADCDVSKRELAMQEDAKSRSTPVAVRKPVEQRVERDDLGEVVRDDPHVAARVLRQWLGSPN